MANDDTETEIGNAQADCAGECPQTAGVERKGAGGMKYNNRFFSNEDEAKAFKKSHGGTLIALKPKSRKETRAAFAAEVMVAYDARGEIVDKDATPFCVAWNER